MECMQCIAQVPRNGQMQQCSRTTCYTLPYCWQHLKLHSHLRIGRTRLRDANGNRYRFKGLFACNVKKHDNAVIFKPNDIIMTYYGEQLNQQQLDTRYPGDQVAPYVVPIWPSPQRYRRRGRRVRYRERPVEVYIDSALMRGVASLANDALPGSQCALGDPCMTNAMLLTTGDNNYPEVIATTNIRNGQEIFVAYGQNYWGGEHYNHRTTPTSVYNRTEYRC